MTAPLPENIRNREGPCYTSWRTLPQMCQAEQHHRTQRYLHTVLLYSTCVVPRLARRAAQALRSPAWTPMGVYSPGPHLLHPRPGMELEGTGRFELQWSDEFDACAANGGTDPASWVHEVGLNRNAELQDYREENARCIDGVLVITADYAPERLPDYCNHPGHLPAGCHGFTAHHGDACMPHCNGMNGTFSSASIVSKRTFVQGQYDARIRLNVQDASWPAWWFTGTGWDPRWPVDENGDHYGWPVDGGAPAQVDPILRTAPGIDRPSCAVPRERRSRVSRPPHVAMHCVLGWRVSPEPMGKNGPVGLPDAGLSVYSIGRAMRLGAERAVGSGFP